MSKILGISAFYHDSAAALVVDGEIVAAAQEERFTRVKHTADFPIHAIKYCLAESGLSLNALDAIVFYDKPLLKFERLLETYYAFAPRGLLSFLKAMPVWLHKKLFFKRLLYKSLSEVEDFDKSKIRLLFTEHHLAHAASAFYASPYTQAATLCIDGVGEWSTASIGLAENNAITFYKEMHFPHSLGLLYSAFTYYLGFTVNSGEYKLMGLAPFGDTKAQQTKDFIQIISSELVQIYDDGSLWLNQAYFSYASGLRMTNNAKWKKLFGISRRKPEAEITQAHCNLAFAIQSLTEEIVIKMANEAKRITQSENLCMAGGVALNCVANGKLQKANIFKNIYIQPAAGDAGGAIGAALAAQYMYFAAKDKRPEEKMKNSFLGPEFTEIEIQQMNTETQAVFTHFTHVDELCTNVSKHLANGKIVGWFQGKMEFGPRALGNRSILADASHSEMQKKLNLKIKFREGFRPFAPAVLAEDAEQFFKMENESPYMLFVAEVKEKLRSELPENFSQLSLTEKLKTKRSQLQAITHVDFTARVQSVSKENNERFWHLLQAFKKQSGMGVLINTSFNVRGEPIVCSPHDAYRCFMSTDMDYLVINNYVYCKTEQVDWQQKTKWKTIFNAD